MRNVANANLYRATASESWTLLVHPRPCIDDFNASQTITAITNVSHQSLTSAPSKNHRPVLNSTPANNVPLEHSEVEVSENSPKGAG